MSYMQGIVRGAVRWQSAALIILIWLITPGFASAAALLMKDQVSTAVQFYFPIHAKSWTVPDGAMLTGMSGEFWSQTATNDFNISLHRIYQQPKGKACPPTASWWVNNYGDWNALFSAFPNPNNLAAAILKRPTPGAVHLPMNYTLPAGYGVPIENCVWAMLNGSNIIAGGLYTMGVDLTLTYETGAAAAALTPLVPIELGDEQCWGINGCQSHTYDNTMQFIYVRKFNADTALRAMHGNSGHSTLQNGPFQAWFQANQASGPWTVTDNLYVVPACAALSGGPSGPDLWEAKLPANKQLFYTRTLGATGVAVKQDPIHQTYASPIIIPKGGCLVHLRKRTGSGSVDSEMQMVLFTQPKLNATHVSMTVPTTMVAGQTYPVTVTVKNQGYGTWTAADKDYLGITGGAMWGIGRVSMPQSVAEKSTVTFTFNVKATTTPGVYKFGTRMLRAGTGWYGSERIVNVTVTPAPPTPAPVITLTANPTSVVSGNASTLSWTSTNATSCTASGAWTGAKALNGSQSTGALTATKTYTLTCTGAGGSTAKSATVTVTPAPVANNAQFISHNVPAAMQTGKTYSATVTFKNTGTATWTAGTNYKLGSQNPANNTTWGVSRIAVPHNVAPGASVTFTVPVKAPATAGTYNFQWQMLREGVEWFGAKSTNVAIMVSNPAAPVVTFTTNPPSVVSGAASTLSWSATNATSCTASGAWSGAKALSGSQSTGPLTAAKTYTLSCAGSGGTTVKSVTVNVTPQAAGGCGVGKALVGGQCVTVPLTGTGDPIGSFDGLKSVAGVPTLYGWAYDPKAPSASMAVHIYVDGPATYLNNYANLKGSVVANLSRPDVNVAKGITGQHGWEWVIPTRYRTGSHTYYIYGINLKSGGANPQIANSPKMVTVPLNSVQTPPDAGE